VDCVVVVDDGSSGATAEIAEHMGAQISRIWRNIWSLNLLRPIV
jgi:glycosyltransferase involved in cell wall biosynthesis